VSESSSEKLRIGIVGGGKAGRTFASAANASALAEVVTFCTTREKSAREAAKACGVPNWTADYESMLQERAIDAVIVASPDKFHCKQTVMAARAGKHVLCEKPMCRSLKEADQMIAAAKKNKVILMIGFTERYNHPCVDAKRRIDAGEIGTPKMILARRCHSRSVVRGREWLNDRETGGVLSFVGTHNIDLICWFMGRKPRRVYAEMGNLILKDRKFTDCAVMTLKFEGGAVATLYETFSYPAAYPASVDRNLEILGDKGVIKLDFMSQPLTTFSEQGQQLGDSITWPIEERGVKGAALAELEHFVQCARENRTPLTPGESGKLALRIAEAARRAARTGKAIAI